jgi:hypothetical protein
MVGILIVVFSFIIIVIMMLNFIKRDRIEMIGDFLVKVMPTIPFTGILKVLKKKKKR